LHTVKVVGDTVEMTDSTGRVWRIIFSTPYFSTAFAEEAKAHFAKEFAALFNVAADTRTESPTSPPDQDPRSQ
jgi:hypothetical protein